MTTYFGGVFVDKEILESQGIKHPIKLEYYKRINEGENEGINKAKFGINIVKTEYGKNKKVEEKGIKYLTNDEKRADYILNVLKNNYVTPIGLEDVMCDFSKKIL